MNGVGAVRKQQEVSAERGQESGLWGCGAGGRPGESDESAPDMIHT